MLVLVLLITTLHILFFTWYFIEKAKYRNLEKKLPGPPVKLLTGNIGEFGNNIYDLFQNSQRILKTYGKIVRVWQGPFRMNVFITDPTLTEFFLSSTTHIKKSSGYDIFKSWLGDGLINSTGEIWMKYRKILTPAFHFSVLDQFPSGFHNNSQILVETLKKKSGETFNIYPYIKLYAIDALCETSMAVNFHSQEAGKSLYVSCLESALRIFMRRFFSVLTRYDSLFALTPESKIYNKLIKNMQEVTLSVIRKRKKELGTNIIEDDKDNDFGIRKKRVFLDSLVEHGGLTEQEIEWQVNTFLFAGQDTVGSCISFSLYELAKHPDVCEIIRKEIIEVVGEDRKAIITSSDLKKLQYLDRVLKECIRLYPPVPLFERELVEDVEIGGLEFPKGTTVSFHPYSHHRNPDLFPDPEVFDPDRFLPEISSTRHPFAYIPFSAGPRNCIGQRYALMNVKIAVANIIRNFDLSPSEDPHTPILGNSAILRSKNGLPIKFIYKK
ncbi:cytochrome P450 4C1-like [Onthophagus taurus]|uniref:cytochrome P450 4C1-like n=1 Tax=Onthophagus taurus TaxID=166361 RepID=UPI000C207E51|nr:cytochrome P450 4C1-like [Onthophagus taurus]XP_022901351.1 cytochrome P450 4C1-like [Onthophagus taurus]